MSTEAAPGNVIAENSAGRIVVASRVTRKLYPELGDGGDSLITMLMKVAEVEAASSNQGTIAGQRQHPANFAAMGRLILHNPYHSACVNAKKSSTIGLGFKSDKVPAVLDELTITDMTAVLNIVSEDFFSVGNGYLEVVRNGVGPDSEIVGLHPVPAAFTYVFDEGDGNWHYELLGTMGGFRDSRSNFKFPRFGDSERFVKKWGMPVEGRNTVSEIIHFSNGSALNKWYGLPNWMSAVSSIELMQALDQREFDFFINRGVPDFMLFISGTKASDEQWTELTNAMKAHIGIANAHKSLAMNFPDADVKIQLEKLDLEGTDQGARFATITDSLSLKIVSAHQVPPLLAGIQIAGKLAANNELPNAIRTFQLLTVAPAQEIFENRLERTLGNPKKNGRLFGARQQKMEFKAITDELDLLAMQALGGAKTPGAAVAKDAGAPVSAGGAAKPDGDAGSAGSAGDAGG
jgi:PBSX family phage portal protein